MENAEREIWRDLSGYEGLYKVSNLGRVKSVHHIIIRSNGWPKTINEKILVSHPCPSGYESVSLHDLNGDFKTAMIHRLVASTFLDNQKKYRVVHHKNSNKKDNRAVNLEWCSNQYNTEHAYKFEGLKCPDSSRAVLQYSLGGELLNEYKNAKEASLAVGCASNSSIISCCKHIYKQVKGYVWRYKKERRLIGQIYDGKVINTFQSMTQAARSVGLKSSNSIYQAVNHNRTAAGFKWKYIN